MMRRGRSIFVFIESTYTKKCTLYFFNKNLEKKRVILVIEVDMYEN